MDNTSLSQRTHHQQLSSGLLFPHTENTSQRHRGAVQFRKGWAQAQFQWDEQSPGDACPTSPELQPPRCCPGAQTASGDSHGPLCSQQDTAFPPAQGHFSVFDPVPHMFQSLLDPKRQVKKGTATKRPRVCWCLFCWSTETYVLHNDSLQDNCLLQVHSSCKCHWFQALTQPKPLWATEIWVIDSRKTLSDCQAMLQRQTLTRHIPYKQITYVYVASKQLPNREAVKSSRDYYRKSRANPAVSACPAHVHSALVQAGPAFCHDTGQSTGSAQGPAHWLWKEAAMQWKSDLQEKIQQSHPEERNE